MAEQDQMIDRGRNAVTVVGYHGEVVAAMGCAVEQHVRDLLAA